MAIYRLHITAISKNLSKLHKLAVSSRSLRGLLKEEALVRNGLKWHLHNIQELCLIKVLQGFNLF
jgi:hypothetical protein